MRHAKQMERKNFFKNSKFPPQFVLFLSSPTVKRRSISLTILPNIASQAYRCTLSCCTPLHSRRQNSNRLHSLGTSTCGSLHQSARDHETSTILSHDRFAQQLRGIQARLSAIH